MVLLFLSRGDESFFCGFVDQLGQVGYPLTKPMLSLMIDSYLITSGIPVDNKYFPISNDTLSRIIQHHSLATAKSDRIDVQRSKQHHPKVRDCMFKVFDNAINRLHHIDPINFPWQSLSKVPPSHIYNMDEVCIVYLLFLILFLYLFNVD